MSPVGRTTVVFRSRDQLVALAARHRIAASYAFRELPETDGLIPP
jgi:hypothetical protein